MSDSASVDVLEVVVAPLGQDQSVALLLYEDELEILVSIFWPGSVCSTPPTGTSGFYLLLQSRR